MQGVFTDNGMHLPVVVKPGRKDHLLFKPFSGEYVHWKRQELQEKFQEDKLLLYRLHHPEQKLIFDNPEHIRDIQLWMKGKLVKNQFPVLLSGIAGILIFLILLWWFALPSLAEAVASRLPLSLDKTMGDAMERTLPYTYKTDTEKTVLMQAFVNRMFPTEKNWKVLVVNKDETNAFALPNGTIVVFSQLVDKLDDGSQLAALLGHETAHVRFRHSTQALAREWAGTFLLFVLTGSGDAGLLARGTDIRNLSFSRKAETQSDKYAVEMLSKKGIAVTGMVKLCEVLLDSSGSGIPQWASTHPQTEERIAFAKQAVRELPFKKNTSLVEELDSLLQVMKKR